MGLVGGTSPWQGGGTGWAWRSLSYQAILWLTVNVNRPLLKHSMCWLKPGYWKNTQPSPHHQCSLDCIGCAQYYQKRCCNSKLQKARLRWMMLSASCSVWSVYFSFILLVYWILTWTKVSCWYFMYSQCWRHSCPLELIMQCIFSTTAVAMNYPLNTQAAGTFPLELFPVSLCFSSCFWKCRKVIIILFQWKKHLYNFSFTMCSYFFLSLQNSTSKRYTALRGKWYILQRGNFGEVTTSMTQQRIKACLWPEHTAVGSIAHCSNVAFGISFWAPDLFYVHPNTTSSFINVNQNPPNCENHKADRAVQMLCTKHPDASLSAAGKEIPPWLWGCPFPRVLLWTTVLKLHPRNAPWAKKNWSMKKWCT